ncbi:MAG: hypothetical protein J6Y01_00735 [Spirochaetales bacterium]|nr:hypothetical protein [Spirochaetales bacterium]
MKKLKLIAIFGTIVLVMMMLAGCPNDTAAKVSFNISDAVALGASGGLSNSRSVGRDGDDAADGSSLIKVMQDGSIKSAVSFEGSIKCANIQSLFKSPVSDDVYILYDGASWASDRILDPLVCVHPNGSYTNLLTQATQFSDNDYLFTGDGLIDFDENGNTYILGFEGGHWENYVYMYNPKTDKRTTLISSVGQHLSEDPSEHFDRIMHGKDGKYLYVGGLYTDTYNFFVRAIPIDNPTDYTQVGGDAHNFGWTYDIYNDCLIVSYDDRSAHQQGTYRISADGKTEGEKIDDDNYIKFIPTKYGVWAFSDYNDDNGQSRSVIKNIYTETDEVFINTASRNMSPYSVFTDKYYDVIGDYIYIIYSGYGELEEGKEGTESDMMSQLFRVNMKDKTCEDVLKNSDCTDHILIYSWSANENVLYYSGKYTGGDVNGKVDLKTLNHERISSSQRLSCLAAM